jgi:copper(I)-binding protein
VTRSTKGIGIRGTARAALLATAVLGTALAVSGCSSGQISQTARMMPAVPGANSTPTPGGDPSIQLRNVTLVYPGVDGYRQGATAPLQLHIFNTGERPVTLVQVTTDAASAVTMTGGAVPSGTAFPPPAASASVSALPSETPSQSERGLPPESASPSGSASRSAGASPSGGASPSESAFPSISAPPFGSASAAPSPGGRPVRVTIAVDGFVELSPATGAALQLDGLTRAIVAGESTTITFVFDNGAKYSLDVPVAVPTTPAPRGSAFGGEGGEAGGAGD